MAPCLSQSKNQALMRLYLSQSSCLPPICHSTSHGSLCSSYTGLLATLWIFWPTPASGPLHLLFPIPGIFFFSWYPHDWFPYLHWNAICQWDLAWITIFKTTFSLFQEFLSSFLFFFFLNFTYLSIYLSIDIYLTLLFSVSFCVYVCVLSHFSHV